MTATDDTTPAVRRGRLSVALVGPDGAGKSTISRCLRDVGLPRPVRVIYMGVNLEASSLMLPTTRLLLAAKRARGRRPDMTPMSMLHGGVVQGRPAGSSAASVATRARRSLKESLRAIVWVLEAWLRQAVATFYALRGYIVVFDRHFVADFSPAEIHDGRAGPTDRNLVRRLLRWTLGHGYPKPDLMIMLDAPAERMHARKPEASVDWLEQRRQEYLLLSHRVPRFIVVDADRPVEAVLAEVAEIIRNSWGER